MAMTILGGLLLLTAFALSAWLWGHNSSEIALAARWFVPVWAGVALANLWVGVSSVGDTDYSEPTNPAVGLCRSQRFFRSF